MLAAKALRGIELTELQQLFLTGDFSSRIEDGRARNLIADAGAKYYWRWRDGLAAVCRTVGDRHGFAGSRHAASARRRQWPARLPLRYESGTSRALFTVEQRFYTDWFPFRLARVGGAIFADVGRTWGSGVIGNSDPGLLRDVGFGLRLGNTRSGLGNVLHIDFAFPLNNIAGIQRFQFLVQTMQSF